MVALFSFKTRDDFELWLFHMDDRLGWLLEYVPKDVSQSFDCTPASLDVFEDWLKEEFPDPGSDRSHEALRLWDAAGCYLGETMRKNLGGVWTVNLTDPKDVYFRLPVVMGIAPIRYTELPWATMGGAARGTTKNTFRSILEARLDQLKNVYRGKVYHVAIISREEFDAWILDMDEALKHFMDQLPPTLGAALDYSTESLTELEKWIVARCKDSMDILNSKYPEISDGAARYIGEVIRRHTGGYWDIVTDKPIKYNRWPIIRGPKTNRFVTCPVWLTVSCKPKRTYLRAAVEKLIA